MATWIILNDHCRENASQEKYQNIKCHTKKRVMKKIPLLPKLAKERYPFSYLLRSEPHSEKGTLFWLRMFCMTLARQLFESSPDRQYLKLQLGWPLTFEHHCQISVQALEQLTWFSGFGYRKQSIYINLPYSFFFQNDPGEIDLDQKLGKTMKMTRHW